MFLHFTYRLVDKTGKYLIGLHGTQDFSKPWPHENASFKREVLDFSDTPQQNYQRFLTILDACRGDPKCLNFKEPISEEKKKERKKPKWPDRSGPNNPMWGRKRPGPLSGTFMMKYSEESRQKMRLACKPPSPKGKTWWTNANRESVRSFDKPGKDWWRGRPGRVKIEREIQAEKPTKVWGRSD